MRTPGALAPGVPPARGISPARPDTTALPGYALRCPSDVVLLAALNVCTAVSAVDRQPEWLGRLGGLGSDRKIIYDGRPEAVFQSEAATLAAWRTVYVLNAVECGSVG